MILDRILIHDRRKYTDASETRYIKSKEPGLKAESSNFSMPYYPMNRSIPCRVQPSIHRSTPFLRVPFSRVHGDSSSFFSWPPPVWSRAVGPEN